MVATLSYMGTRPRLDLVAIGDRVVRRRAELRYQQKDVAARACMSRAYISRLENGVVPNPKLEDLAAVATALDYPLDRLVYGHPSADVDDDIANLLVARFGPQIGSAFARLDMVLANLDKGEVDAALLILETISERGERRRLP